MRRPTQRQKPQKAKLTSFPAPTGGLVSNRNLAMARSPDMPPGAAVMDDWFPTATGAILRRGSVRNASMVEDEAIESLFTFTSGNQREFFAASASGIRDITTVADADAWAGPDVLRYQTSGNWNVVQFATSGGEFLIGVNGEDDLFIYNGTFFTGSDVSFDSGIISMDEDIYSFDRGPIDISVNITFPSGVSLTTADLSYVWVYKQRLWFLQKDSMDAWYLPVDSIGGELTLWPMGGVFTKGGSLMWGQAWSLDSGGSGGLSEQCVFTTTEGEVAAYQGLSPEVDQGWTKVGVYRIGKPLGDKAFMRAGGDLVIATSVGFISLAAASRQDYAALGQNAVSYPIEDEWAAAVSERGQVDWRVEVWPDGQMALIAPPPLSGTVPMVFVVNVNTGKWCRFRNWQVESLSTFGSGLYFGSEDGGIRQAWVTGADEGLPYVGQILPLFEDLGAPGSMKVVKNARPVVLSAKSTTPQVSAHFDYMANFPAAYSASSDEPGSQWDVGIWDQSTWNSQRAQLVSSQWVPIGGSGHDVAVGVQVTSGATVPIDAELVRIDMTYTTGQAVS